MRTTRDLFPTLIEPGHLTRAARRTTRGKAGRPDVAWFLLNRSARLDALQGALEAQSWRPQPIRLVHIQEPKPRWIARSPVEDRVVHAALVLAMEPALTRSLRPETFACRPGFGTHRALLALQRALQRHRFALHLDVRAYLPSIDLDILSDLLAQRIRDGRFLAVCHRVLESGRGLLDRPELRRRVGYSPDWPPEGQGLPIGAWTSQVWASHLYLDAFDHFVKRELKVPGYLRYVDDLFLFARGRAELRAWRAEVAAWLWAQRRLRLKHPHARVLSCAGSLHALGHRVRREGIAPLPRSLRRLQRRIGGPADPDAMMAATWGAWRWSLPGDGEPRQEPGGPPRGTTTP